MPITYPRTCPTCGKKYKNGFDFCRHKKYSGSNVKVPCLHCDEVDDKLYAFEQLYHEILNEHAPLKQTIVRGNQVPYMTEQCRKAIRHRNKLWRLFKRDRTDANYDHYKIQRNICTSLRRKALKEHFVKNSSEPKKNPREFWNAYRLFLHGKTNQANDIIMKENYVVISDKREIAELFNARFIQIAEGI